MTQILQTLKETKYPARHFAAITLLVLLLGIQPSGVIFFQSAIAGSVQAPVSSDAKPRTSRADTICDSTIPLRTAIKLARRVDKQESKFLDTSALSDIAWSNEDNIIASYTNLGAEVNMWDAQTGELLGHYTGSASLAASKAPVFLAGDKKFIATVALGAQGKISLSVMNVLTQHSTSTPNMADGLVIGDVPADFLSYSLSTGQLAIVGGSVNQKIVKIYDLSNGIPRLTIQIPPAIGYGSAITFSPDGHLLFVGSFAGGIKVYNTKSWKVDRTIEAFPKDASVSKEVNNAVASLAVSPSGKLLLIGAGGIQVFRHRPSDLPAGLRDPNLAAELFVSGKTNSAIRVYNLENSSFLDRDTRSLQPIDSLAWINENSFAFLDGNDRIGLFQVQENLARFPLGESPISSFAFSPRTGKLVISMRSDATIFNVCTFN